MTACVCSVRDVLLQTTWHFTLVIFSFFLLPQVVCICVTVVLGSYLCMSYKCQLRVFFLSVAPTLRPGLAYVGEKKYDNCETDTGIRARHRLYNVS